MTAWLRERSLEYATFISNISNQSSSEWRTKTRPFGAGLDGWLMFTRHSGSPLLSQFWKIHLSVHPRELKKLFDLIESVLIRQQAAFKFPNSLTAFMAMNDTVTSPAQVGKIVTVYPQSELELISLVDTIRAVWSRGKGPRIVSDLYDCEDSRVSIRWGQCGEAITRVDACGRKQSEILSPTGESVTDKRSIFGEQPGGNFEHIVGGRNFKALDLSVPKQVALGEEMYVIQQSFGPWFKQCLLAVNEKGQDICIRRVHRGSFIAKDGSTVDERLKTYLKTLSALHWANYLTGSAPRLHEDKEFLYLISTKIPGVDLSNVSFTLDKTHLLKIIEETQRLHSLGVVHRDLKPTNILFTSINSSAALIDFELTAPVGTTGYLTGGTEGYRPPEYASEDATLSFAYDVYSIGALS